MSPPQPCGGSWPGSSWLGWGVLVVLGSPEAELAGELLAESVVLGLQAGDLGAGGIEPLGGRIGGGAVWGGAGGWGVLWSPLGGGGLGLGFGGGAIPWGARRMCGPGFRPR